jgi:hypothetical protein
LTANLQLQLRCNPPGRPPRSRGPDSSAWFEHRAFLGKLRSKAPPRHASRPRRYRPLSGRAALPLTSSVAAAPFELGLSASPALATTRPRLHSRLVKDDRFTGTRTPSTGDFSPASAIRTAHEHNHEPSDPGSTSPTSACPARTGPTGLRPHPPCRPPNPDDAGASVPARSLRTVTGPSTQRLPGRLESGARRRCRRGTSRFTRCASVFALRRRPARSALRRMPRCRGDVRSRELRPNPIRPDTSRHETAAIPAGDPIPCAAGRPKPDADSNDPATRALRPCELQAHGPPYALLAQAARGVPPAFTGGAGEPNGGLR